MGDILDHPSLGRVQGKLQDGVLQFLGIKYATLRDRFAEPVLTQGSEKEHGVLDATQHGPMVASNPGACDFEHGLIGHALPHEPFQVSDVDGLNLNISVPWSDQRAVNPDGALPVCVYIHGGGFAIGSNSWPQFDLARFVRLSARTGSPVIAIGINYRLGVPGFLTSSEMRAAGYRANNGLRDQRTSLAWIKKYIRGFGGDAENITVIGQSAGGTSAVLHLYSKEPLFNRLMIIGGTHLMFTPLPPEAQEHVYGAVIQKLGLQTASAEERIDALKALPVEELYTKFGFEMPLIPVCDEQLVPNAVETFSNVSKKDGAALDAMPGKRWCKSLLIGDAEYDGIVFHEMLAHKKRGATKAFCDTIRKSLSDHPAEADALLAAYNITPELPDDVGFQAITLFGTDITFHVPTIEITKGWPTETYLFHFNSPNPWEGPSKGIAGHTLDVAFLFQNYNEFLPNEQKVIAETFAKQVIDFVNGRAPFPAYKSGAGGAMVFGPPAEGAEFVQTEDPAKLGRRKSLVPIASKIGYDPLARAWVGFMIGG